MVAAVTGHGFGVPQAALNERILASPSELPSEVIGVPRLEFSRPLEPADSCQVTFSASTLFLFNGQRKLEFVHCVGLPAAHLRLEVRHMFHGECHGKDGVTVLWTDHLVTHKVVDPKVLEEQRDPPISVLCELRHHAIPLRRRVERE
jgi:hypothetical protein